VITPEEIAGYLDQEGIEARKGNIKTKELQGIELDHATLLRKYQKMLAGGELAPQNTNAGDQSKACWGEPERASPTTGSFLQSVQQASPILDRSERQDFQGNNGKRKQGLLDARLQLSGDDYKQVPNNQCSTFDDTFIQDATESQFDGQVWEMCHGNHADLQREILCSSHMRNVIHKLGSAAAMFRGDPKRHPAFYPFRKESIKPQQLQQQCLRSFSVRLSDKENDVLVEYLDRRRCGVVECEVFLKYFWLFGRTYRKLAAELEKKKNLEGEKRKKKELKRHLRRFAYHPPAAMKPYNKRHLQHVLDEFAEITHVFDYDTLQVKLKHFDNNPPMNPSVFRDTLYRNFRLKVSPEELSALMDHFDVERTGTVRGEDFIRAAAKLGREKRSHGGQQWRQWRLQGAVFHHETPVEMEGDY
jgi:hypothetical protein